MWRPSLLLVVLSFFFSFLEMMIDGYFCAARRLKVALGKSRRRLGKRGDYRLKFNAVLAPIDHD